MRTTLTIAALLFCRFCFSQVDLSKGLMAYYPFSGNANDASGNGNNAIFNNAALTSDYYGNPNSAYYFNGIDNYMEIANAPGLNMSQTISVCAWVKPAGFYYGPCHGNRIVMKGDNDFLEGNYLLTFDDTYYTMGQNCSNPIPDTIHETFYGRATNLKPVDDTPFAQKNTWHSLVYTYDGVTAKLYVDCKLILSTAADGLSFSNSYDLFLGKMNNTQFPYWFNGVMDEVRIYNRAINADEVKAYSVSCADNEPCNNWLKVNSEISGVQIGDLDVAGDQLTVEAVINRTTQYPEDYDGGDVVSKHDNPSDANYLLRPTVAQLTTTNGFFQTNKTCKLELNKTYHIAMVYDGKSLKFFRNGFLMDSVVANGNLYQNDWLTAIGTTANFASPYPADFIGYINEVRIWRVARNKDQISAYMNKPLPNPSSQPGLLAYYTFDNLQNKQGNNQWNGTLFGNAAINKANPTCAGFVADSCNTCVKPLVSAGNNVSVCAGDSTVLQASGALDYKWESTPYLSDITIYNPIAYPVQTSDFIVTGFTAKDCFASDTVNVIVNPLPPLNAGSDIAVCKQDSVVLQATGADTYKWQMSSYLSNTSIANPFAFPDITTDFIVTGFNVNECSSTDTITVSVNPLPSTNAGNDVNVCAGDSTQLNATGAASYVWDPVPDISDETISNPVVKPVQSKNYVVTGKTAAGCKTTDTIYITVLQSLVNAGNNKSICGNITSVQLNGSGATEYLWKPAGTLSNNNIALPAASPLVTTTYFLSGIDINGCKATDSVTVFVKDDPVFNISPGATVCKGDTIYLRAFGGDTYQWFSSQFIANPSDSFTYSLPVSNAIYFVKINDSTCAVTDTLQLSATVKSAPETSITKSNDIDCTQRQAMLSAAGGISYIWYADSTINNPHINNPFVQPKKDTWYKVLVTAGTGCSATDSILVKVTQGTPLNFLVPNAFTPNNDGINDCYSLKYWAPADFFDISIYDRWGVEVYHSTDVSQCWNGTYKNMRQPAGTYVYQVKAKFFCTADIVYQKGTIVLIR